MRRSFDHGIHIHTDIHAHMCVYKDLCHIPRRSVYATLREPRRLAEDSPGLLGGATCKARRVGGHGALKGHWVCGASMLGTIPLTLIVDPYMKFVGKLQKRLLW